MKIFQLMFVLMALTISALGQYSAEIVAANGQKHKIAGRDRQRNSDELIYYTLEYYKKSPTNQSGIDVLVTDGKAAIIQDRAGAVFIEKKPDPGAINTTKKALS